MLIKRFLVLSFVFMAIAMYAQHSPEGPQRTPEEEAMKQTTRLVRELGIKDSARFDTLYKMHLKYAKWRQKGLTRGENMQRMQAIHRELQMLLTKDEFERFMNHPSEAPHRPHGTPVLVPTTPGAQTDSLSASRQ